MTFQGRNFNVIQDFTQAELNYLIDFAIHLKQLKQKRIPHHYLEGQTIALLFDKTSTRTRSAFTVAAQDLGAHAEFMGAGDVQFGKKESDKDSAIVFGSMFDGIQLRVSKQETVDTFCEYAGVPIWNGMTNDWHPTQMLADFMTIKEVYGSLAEQSLVYLGDGRNNVAHSLMIMGAIMGVSVTIASPEALAPASEVLAEAQVLAQATGAKIRHLENPLEAVADASVLYTDVWASMGEEAQFQERIQQLMPYQVNQELVQHCQKPYIFLHCLPAFHDSSTQIGAEIKHKYGLEAMEVMDDVFESPEAYQFQQAENRLHTIKAVMAITNGNLFIPDLA